MNKNNKITSFLRQSFAGLTAVLFMIYVLLQISMSIGDSITVESAVYASSVDYVSLSGLIFRDEYPIMNDSNGTACLFFADGEKVSKGAEVLKIYMLESDAEKQSRINELTDKISLLEKCIVMKNYSTSEKEKMANAITEKINSIMRSVSSGDLTAASLGEDELLINMNKRQSVVRNGVGYTRYIKEYESEIESLNEMLTSEAEVVVSYISGYYYADCDGYENELKVSLLDDLTLAKYDELYILRPDTELVSNNLGKIVASSKWYTTAKMDKREFYKLTGGKSSDYTYYINFPYFNNTEIKMKLYKVISQTDSDEVVAIFCTDEVPEGFNFSRKQPITIASESYSGLRIQTSAIRVGVDENGREYTFVYTLNGTVVSKKNVTMLYDEGNGYCICELPDKDDINKLSKTSLSLYDPVVVQGKDIYEGKIIN